MADKVLEKIINEVAKDMGVRPKIVWAVYKHFLNYIYRMMTKVRLKHMSKEYIREHAVNINIPGFGRILNKYGKTIKDRTSKGN